MPGTKHSRQQEKASHSSHSAGGSERQSAEHESHQKRGSHEQEGQQQHQGAQGRGREEQGQERGQRRGTQSQARKAHEEQGQAGEENEHLDLNQAEESQLEELIMMGPHRAKALVEHRPFKSWEDVEKVPGFSTGMIEDLKESGATIGSED